MAVFLIYVILSNVSSPCRLTSSAHQSKINVDKMSDMVHRINAWEKLFSKYLNTESNGCVFNASKNSWHNMKTTHQADADASFLDVGTSMDIDELWEKDKNMIVEKGNSTILSVLGDEASLCDRINNDEHRKIQKDLQKFYDILHQVCTFSADGKKLVLRKRKMRLWRRRVQFRPSKNSRKGCHKVNTLFPSHHQSHCTEDDLLHKKNYSPLQHTIHSETHTSHKNCITKNQWKERVHLEQSSTRRSLCDPDVSISERDLKSDENPEGPETDFESDEENLEESETEEHEGNLEESETEEHEGNLEESETEENLEESESEEHEGNLDESETEENLEESESEEHEGNLDESETEENLEESETEENLEESETEEHEGNLEESETEKHEENLGESETEEHEENPEVPHSYTNNNVMLQNDTISRQKNPVENGKGLETKMLIQDNSQMTTYISEGRKDGIFNEDRTKKRSPPSPARNATISHISEKAFSPRVVLFRYSENVNEVLALHERRRGSLSVSHNTSGHLNETCEESSASSTSSGLRHRLGKLELVPASPSTYGSNGETLHQTSVSPKSLKPSKRKHTLTPASPSTYGSNGETLHQSSASPKISKSSNKKQTLPPVSPRASPRPRRRVVLSSSPLNTSELGRQSKELEVECSSPNNSQYNKRNLEVALASSYTHTSKIQQGNSRVNEVHVLHERHRGNLFVSHNTSRHLNETCEESSASSTSSGLRHRLGKLELVPASPSTYGSNGETLHQTSASPENSKPSNRNHSFAPASPRPRGRVVLPSSTLNTSELGRHSKELEVECASPNNSQYNRGNTEVALASSCTHTSNSQLDNSRGKRIILDSVSLRGKEDLGEKRFRLMTKRRSLFYV